MATMDTVSVALTQEQNYAFSNDFGAGVILRSDEPAPLGGGAGPSPVGLLAAAVGNCLAASLLFALRKYKQRPEPIRARVEAEVGRNEQNRLRVRGMKVRLDLGVPAAGLEHLDKALAQFEDFCTVTASVRPGVPVEVEVFDSTGARLKH
jgi:uncharacterized OsmC-like protein